MLRDASQQQVIEKFSFIYTLTYLSSSENRGDNSSTEKKRSKREQLPDVETRRGAASQHSQLATTSSVAGLSSLTSTIVPQWYQRSDASQTDSWSPSAIIRFSEVDSPLDDFPQERKHYLGKILLFCACGYLLVALWWLFGDRSSQFFAILTRKQQIVLSNSDAEFIDYMERSLASIDRQLQVSQQEAEKIAKESDEILYIPVYTPTPSTPAIPQVINGNSNQNPQYNAATPPPEPPSVVKIPAPPPLPEPTPIPEPKAEPETAIATSVTPAIKHTLVGILDLGDKSAALFKIEDRTERIWLGEEIENSGWILESINDQKATISYQGKLRALSVGETF
ncbi:MAG: hypothetical protein Tsb0014_12330 [Pleurocapsa sp.]